MFILGAKPTLKSVSRRGQLDRLVVIVVMQDGVKLRHFFRLRSLDERGHLLFPHVVPVSGSRTMRAAAG